MTPLIVRCKGCLQSFGTGKKKPAPTGRTTQRGAAWGGPCANMVNLAGIPCRIKD
jgi:hypothetical protein